MKMKVFSEKHLKRSTAQIYWSIGKKERNREYMGGNDCGFKFENNKK